MKKTTRKRLLGGLSGVFALLLALSISGTTLLYKWEPFVNAVLNLSSNVSISGGDVTSESLYYKSSFGDISALYKSDPTQEELDAMLATQDRMIAAKREFVLREFAEGSVLLKNDEVDGKPALPLDPSERNVSLMGNASGNPVYRSPGAGPMPARTDGLVAYEDAFRNAGFQINETLLDAYKNSGIVRNNTSGAAIIGEVDGSFYTDELKNTFASYGDAAIVLLSRVGGEGRDLQLEDSDGVSQLALHPQEEALLQMIHDSGAFRKTIVLINSVNPMELEWLNDERYGVDAALWIGEPGTYGFEAAVDLLCGTRVPSGRLVDTYATNSNSSPAMINFGDRAFTNASTYKYVAEAEGIYVGYRYYETRYEDLILGNGKADSTKGSSTGDKWNYADEVTYPFGYGLSYSTFEQKLDEVTYDSATDTYSVQVTVTNTGNVPGKFSVLVYAQTPYNAADGIEKSAIQLVGFEKTLGEGETAAVSDRNNGVLQPGASETLTVQVPRYFLASYSTQARNGVGGYVLSGGDYYFAIGDNVHDALNNILAAKGGSGMTDQNGNEVSGDAEKTYQFTLEKDENAYAKSPYTGVDVANTMERTDANYWQKDSVTYLSRADWDGTWPVAVTLEASEDMKKELNAGVYKAASDAPAKGTYKTDESNGILFIDMKDVPYSGTYTDADGKEHNADEMWDKFLSQFSLDELAAVTSTVHDGAAKVNAPTTTAVDGPDGVGSNMQNGKTTSCFPSGIMAAATFNKKTMALRGDFLAEEAIFAKVTVLWGPGANLHRTPYGGRNYEYFSEDPIHSYLCIQAETKATQDKGLICTVKHYVGNEQETNRNQVATFNNEQAWREIYLRSFEGLANNTEGAIGVMTAFSNIGCTAAASCRETNVQILQKEWGFHGINYTDLSNGKTYINTGDSLMNGTTKFCGDNRENDVKKLTSRSKYDDYLGALREINKAYYYNILRSNVVNGITANAKIVSDTPWWKPATTAALGVLALIEVGLLAAYIVTCIPRKGKKESSEGGNIRE
ncbi:MAG: glycoside hydrolase family 3 protein [Clostridia bacterium]|nr:glycoside hydrolase family 3 protein [Clostridia bacterium]